MMTGTTWARCLSVMLLAFGLLALLLAAGCATNTSQQSNADMAAANTPRVPVSPTSQTPSQPASPTSQTSFYSKLVLAGRLDCKTNNVEVTEGVLERGRFENLDTLSAVLADKGYGRAALAELKDLKVCLLDEDDSNAWRINRTAK